MHTSDNNTVWVIRSGKKCVAHDLFYEKSIIALAAQHVPDLSAVASTREAFKAKVLKSEKLQDLTPSSIGHISSTLFRFVCEMSIGDTVLYPSTAKDRKVNLGVVVGNYSFSRHDSGFPHQRAVRWIGTIPRDSLHGRPLKEISYFYQFYKVKQASDYFLKLAERLEQAGV